MSTNLPPFPNLEHLRKQAKALLTSMREEDARTRLSDAQFSIARHYGFESWPQLKRYVEEFPSRVDRTLERREGRPPTMDPALVPPDGRFARYTKAAQRVIFLAYRRARERGSRTIEPEHVLLGLLEEPDGHIVNVLEIAGVPAEHLRAAVRGEAEKLPRDENISPVIGPGPSFTRAIERGAQEADRLKHSRIGTPHLLLGIAAAGGSIAAQTMKRFGLTEETTREAFGRSIDPP
jgi:hypothetical protein